MKTKLFLIAFLSCMISPAHALVDIRAGYGMSMGSPTQLNNDLDHSISGATGIKALSGLNADVVVNLPLVPIGFGLRYESLSSSISTTIPGTSASFNTKLQNDRIALLLNYRIIDTLVYVGPIATYGLVNTSKLTFDCGSCTPATHLNGKAASASSYSLGVEGGAKLLQFRVGGELGYSSYIGKDYTDGSNVYQDYTGSNVKVDLTGVYAKILVGIGF